MNITDYGKYTNSGRGDRGPGDEGMRGGKVKYFYHFMLPVSPARGRVRVTV